MADDGIDYEHLCERLREADTELTEVEISSGVDSILVEALANNSVVKSVSIENAVGLGDALANAVATMPALVKIRLRSVGLSTAGARKLVASPSWSQLRLLDLRDNPKLGPRGIQPIVDKLSQAENLDELNLSNCRMGHFGAKAMGDVDLPSSLKVLDLSCNAIGNDGAWKLAPALDALTSLELLSLSKNQIGDDGASEIGCRLPSTLKVLVMRDNEIADVGARTIASALVNSKIEKVVLANNNIGSSGATALSWTISQSSYLQELDLNENEVGDEGAAALATNLVVTSEIEDGEEELATSSLTVLRLKDNKIGDAGAGAFVEHLDQNRRLQVLDLAGNDGISAARFTILDMILKHRTQPRRVSAGGGGTFTPPGSPLRTQEENKDAIFNEGRRILSQSGPDPVEVPSSYLELCTDHFDARTILSYGAFGELFNGVDLDETFLIRRVFVGPTGDGSEARERALNEILALKHDNILPLKAFSRGPALDCFVYEWEDATSLDACISNSTKRKEMTWKIRLKVLCGVANGLDFLHNGGRRSRFHGDVKSGNIFITNDYTARLVDGGIAQLVTANALRFRSGDVVYGSRGYRCPRYERGSRKYTPESDVFSYGIVMAEACTGRLQNDTIESTKQRHDFYYDYIVDKKRDLLMDCDESAGAFDEKAFATVCKITLSCMDSEPIRRPGTSSIVRLLDSILKR